MTYCPRCQNPLPEPPERFCPSCGADIEQLPPPLPPEEPATAPGARAPGFGEEGTPWERRGRIGFASALIDTTQQVFTAPARFFRAMPVTGGMGSPLLYALIIGYAGIVVSAIYDFVLESVVGTTFGTFGGGGEAMARMMPYFQGAIGLGIKLLLGPVMLAASLFIVSGLVHLGLMALGGASRGFEATFRVTCYSEASAILHVIPLCGQPLAAVYMLVLMIIGLSEAHGTSKGRAAAAVLLPILLCCCCIFIPLAGFFATLASRMH